MDPIITHMDRPRPNQATSVTRNSFKMAKMTVLGQKPTFWNISQKLIFFQLEFTNDFGKSTQNDPKIAKKGQKSLKKRNFGLFLKNFCRPKKLFGLIKFFYEIYLPYFDNKTGYFESVLFIFTTFGTL